MIQNEAINATYEILGEIGSGGGGVVYHAIHKRLKTDVVIKRIRNEVVNKLEVRQEADVLKKLKHPYLPRVYDFIEAEDGIYTVMDYIAGQNMEQALIERGRFTPAEVYKIALELGEALDYLHKQNPPIIHSDIKPANIMITPEGDICLIDFNISLAMGESEESAVGISAGFSPPEQYRDPQMYARITHNYTLQKLTSGGMNSGKTTSGTELIDTGTVMPGGEALQGFSTTYLPFIGRGITTRSDIYSLGMCFVSMLTGLKPEFDFDKNKKIEEYKLNITEGFATIINKMISIDPMLRYKDGVELFTALKECKKLDKRYVAMHRKQLGLSIASVALIVVGAGIMTLGGLRLKSEKESVYYAYIDDAEKAIEELDFDRAEDYIDKAREDRPENVAAYKEEVYALYMQGDFDACIGTGTGYLTSQPFYIENDTDWNYYADLCYVVGNAFFEMGDYSNAENYLKAAIENYDNNPGYYRDYAILAAKLGDLKSAKRYLKEANSIGLADESSNMVEGEIAYMEGDLDKAISLLTGVLDVSSDVQTRRRALSLCIDMFRSLGDERIDEEIEILEKIYNSGSDADRVMVSGYLADSYSHKGAIASDSSYYNKAIAVLETMVSEGNATFAIQSNLGVVYENSGNLEKAEEIFKGLIDKYPKNYVGYMRMAFLEADKQQQLDITMRDYTVMADYYDLACELCPDIDSEPNMQVLKMNMQDVIDGGWLLEREIN